MSPLFDLKHRIPSSESQKLHDFRSHDCLFKIFFHQIGLYSEVILPGITISYRFESNQLTVTMSPQISIGVNVLIKSSTPLEVASRITENYEHPQISPLKAIVLKEKHILNSQNIR